MRRIGAAFCIALAAALAGAAARDAIARRAEPLPDIFPAVREVRAAHHLAKLTLFAVLNPATGLPTFEFDGETGGAPTIRVRPGDTIELTVEDDMSPLNGHSDAVNVHFHGLTVAPAPPGDEVLHTLAHDGQTLRYRVRIPADHEPGLYWYHPHVHGESFYDVTSGMSGAIVVEGLQDHIPALRAMRERIIVLRDVPIGSTISGEDMPSAGTGKPASAPPPGITPPGLTARGGVACRPESGLQPTLNGQPRAQIGIRRGERQLFRVVNASAGRYFDLSVDRTPLQLVALDGFPLDAYPGTPAVRTVRHVLLPPAARAEFVVTGTGRPAVLRTACFDSGRTGDADPAADLADLVDPDPAATASPPAPLRALGPLPRNFYARPAPAPARRRTIRFTEDGEGFFIDGKAFGMDDMDGPPSIEVRSGTLEEWTLLNETDEVHDFHIHQVHFVPLTVDGVSVLPRTWMDTVNLPARRAEGGRYVPGTVRVLIDFRDPIVRGTFVFHCHILDHEDLGMMATIRVR